MNDFRNMTLGLVAVLFTGLLTGCCGVKLRHNCCALEDRPGGRSEAGRLVQMKGWDRRTHTHSGREHAVWCLRAGESAPPVVVLHELPGFTPDFIALCERLHGQGFTVYAPLYFGEVGDNRPLRYSLRVLWDDAWAVRRPDFSCDELAWTRSLIRQVEAWHPDQRIGVVGNCLTGSFALGSLTETAVFAAVISQPSLPFHCNAQAARSVGLSKGDLAAVTARVKQEEIPVLGLRCELDSISPVARFVVLREQLGESLFLDRTIQKDEYGAFLPENAHAVLTGCFSDQEGNPARLRFFEAVNYLHARLDSKNE